LPSPLAVKDGAGMADAGAKGASTAGVAAATGDTRDGRRRTATAVKAPKIAAESASQDVTAAGEQRPVERELRMPGRVLVNVRQPATYGGPPRTILTAAPPEETRAIESFDTAPAPSSSPASPPSVGETGSHEDARVLRHEPVAVPSIDRHLNDQRPTVKPITITAAASLPTAATYCRRGVGLNWSLPPPLSPSLEASRRAGEPEATPATV